MGLLELAVLLESKETVKSHCAHVILLRVAPVSIHVQTNHCSCLFVFPAYLDAEVLTKRHHRDFWLIAHLTDRLELLSDDAEDFNVSHIQSAR